MVKGGWPSFERNGGDLKQNNDENTVKSSIRGLFGVLFLYGFTHILRTFRNDEKSGKIDVDKNIMVVVM